MIVAAAILAHQGGWDEFLLVATPIAIIAGVLWLVKRRVEAGTAVLDPNDFDPDEIDPDEIDPDEIDPDEIDPDGLDTGPADDVRRR